MKTEPKNILVRSPNWIGDQVLAFPFFYHLRKGFPNSKITTVCVPWVKEVQFDTLVDEVIVMERARPGSSLWEKMVDLDRQSLALKSKGSWDLAISLPNSFSSAWTLFRSGAKVRRGYSGDARGLFLNSILAPKEERFGVHHRAQAYLDLLPDSIRPRRPVHEFWGVYPENDLDEKIQGELDDFDFRRFWPTEPMPRPESAYWVLAPGATADSRRWPLDYFIALARKIALETNWVGVVVGGPKEAPLAERICQQDGLRLIDRTARGSIRSLAPVFRHAQVTVTNESGLAHVASLCGSFTQIVCGAADPRRTKPIGPGPVQVSINTVECWPCERNECSQGPETYLQCLKGIKPDAVWEEIQRGLRKFSS